MEKGLTCYTDQLEHDSTKLLEDIEDPAKTSLTALQNEWEKWENTLNKDSEEVSNTQEVNDQTVPGSPQQVSKVNMTGEKPTVEKKFIFVFEDGQGRQEFPDGEEKFIFVFEDGQGRQEFPDGQVVYSKPYKKNDKAKPNKPQKNKMALPFILGK